MRSSVVFTVNGESMEVSGEKALAPLSDTLRYGMGRTGTKVVCAEGDCGACTVLLARVGEEKEGRAHFRSINSCIYPTFLADGTHLVTVEGLEDADGLHEVQRSMVKHFGGQCGFCTPGFVVSLVNLYEQKSKPTERHLKNALTGNLCRCTGYQPILEAGLNVDSSRIVPLSQRYGLGGQTAALREKKEESILIETPEKEFFGPATLAEAVDYRRRHPDCRIFSGATDIGVQINKGKDPGRHLMALHGIEALNVLEREGNQVRVGARVTLERLEEFAKTHLPAVAEFLSIFASPQIKNAATLIGNLANGSPIADTTPFLMVFEGKVGLVGPKGIRNVPLENFFLGYKTFSMEPEEFIAHVEFDLPSPDAKIGLYKVSQRRDLDISCVNAAFCVELDGKSIGRARVAMGGIGPTPQRLTQLESALEGAVLDRALADRLQGEFGSWIAPISDVRGTDAFRRLVGVQLFGKFIREKFGL